MLRRKKHRLFPILSVLLSLLMILLPLSPVFATSVRGTPKIIATGKCGTDAFWAFDSTGTLTISGSGVTEGYSLNYEQPPWDEYRPQITAIVVEDGITVIEEWFFCNCSEATSITIPPSLTRIETWAFYGCSSLSDVYITDLDAWCRIHFNSSPMSSADHMYINGELVTEMTIPADMQEVGRGFSGWGCLTSLTIPDTVTSIAPGAFSGLSGLTELTIPDSITTIPEYAFSGCSGLTRFTVPAGVTSIGENAFASCHRLTGIEIPDTVTSIGPGAFSYCDRLTDITLPDGITSIGDETFRACYSLTELTIPEGVTGIGELAFCSSGLTHLTIPASVTAIGTDAFGYCTDLNELRFLGSYPDGGVSFDRACYSCYYSCTNATWENAPKSRFHVDWKGHLYDNYVYNNDATCTQDGTMTGTCPECGAKETITAPKTAMGHSFGTDGRCITCGSVPQLIVEMTTCDVIRWHPGTMEVYADDELVATMSAPEGTTIREELPYDSRKTYTVVWASWLLEEEGFFRVLLNGHELANGKGWDYQEDEVIITLEPGCKHEYAKGYCPCCGEYIPDKGCVSGTVQSFGEDSDPVTLTWIPGGADTAAGSVELTGNRAQYTIDNIAPGQYTLIFSKKNHVPLECVVTVEPKTMGLPNVRLHLLGDLDGNGKVNAGDLVLLFAHLQGRSCLTEEYRLLCGNVNGGVLNMGDVGMLYAHIKGTRRLY